MELQHLCGGTYILDGKTALIPLYRINDTDIILLDTGLAHGDREDLSALLEANHFCVRGIICTHAHYDHTGNARFLQQKYHCLVAMPEWEAGIAASPEAFRANYHSFSYGQCRAFFEEEWVKADVLIPQDANNFTFCAINFSIIPLFGHTVGQIGVVTPDNVAYLADSVIDAETLAHFKLPTMMDVAQDIATKNTLQALNCNAYILAHKKVVTDLGMQIEANLAHIGRTEAEMVGCLRGGMSKSEWLAAFSLAKEIHTKKEFNIGVLNRNFIDFVDYLCDFGRVKCEVTDSVARYFPA